MTECHRTVGLGVGSSFSARDEVLHHPAIAELAGYLMQKHPCAIVQRLHPVLLTTGFLICIAFVVAGGERRLKLEVVPKFNTQSYNGSDCWWQQKPHQSTKTLIRYLTVSHYSALWILPAISTRSLICDLFLKLSAAN